MPWDPPTAPFALELALLNDSCHLRVVALEHLLFLGLGRKSLRDSRDAGKDTAVAVNLASILLQLSAQEAGDSRGISGRFLNPWSKQKKKWHWQHLCCNRSCSILHAHHGFFMASLKSMGACHLLQQGQHQGIKTLHTVWMMVLPEHWLILAVTWTRCELSLRIKG